MPDISPAGPTVPMSMSAAESNNSARHPLRRLSAATFAASGVLSTSSTDAMTRLAQDHKDRTASSEIQQLKDEFLGKQFEDEDGKWVVCAIKKSRKKSENGQYVVYYHDAKITTPDDDTPQHYSKVDEVREWICQSRV